MPRPYLHVFQRSRISRAPGEQLTVSPCSDTLKSSGKQSGFQNGGVAQLGARLNGIEKVRGSNPLTSIQHKTPPQVTLAAGFLLSQHGSANRGETNRRSLFQHFLGLFLAHLRDPVLKLLEQGLHL